MAKAISGISKKILVVSVVALFLISMMFFVAPGKIYALVYSPETDFTYTLAGGNATDVMYIGSATTVDIPLTLGGNTVTSIGDWAFMNCSSLTSISIPSTVTSIGRGAFDGCTGLTSISIPSGVTSIGDYAFNGCTGLTSISMPSTVTSIGGWAFHDCTGLTSISIPSGVTSIGEYAFYNSGLTSITIPSGVTSIGGWAFYQMGSLASITFDSATTTISDSADTITAAAKIMGYDPSTAKTYATTYGRTFESIGAPPDSTPSSPPPAPPKPLTPEAQVSLGLSISEQVNLYGASNTGFTKMLYDNILGRVSDSSGLNDWVTALNNGTITLGDVVYYFVFSKELEPIISVASPEEFITFLYENVLNRNADSEGYAGWVSAMKNGMTKEEVLLHFIDSDEFRNICTMFGLTA